MDVNWAPARVRRNFRIDTFSAICGGVYISVLITFMPIVVRRLGGSTIDVAIVIAAPFVGHLLSPISAYLLMGFPQVRVVAGTVTLARATFLAGVLVEQGWLVRQQRLFVVGRRQLLAVHLDGDGELAPHRRHRAEHLFQPGDQQ